MKKSEITIRDPFILNHNGKYYLYGTRSKYTWRAPEEKEKLGFDVYISDDLTEWSNPIEVFRRPDDFWAIEKFWAPEVYFYKEEFYMFATFGHPHKCKGTQVLKAASPEGPFHVYSKFPLTPCAWECLDGTLFIDSQQTPYMIFCHEWQQIADGDGEIWAVQLSKDISRTVSESKILFKASEPFWADKRSGQYVTDGPFLYELKNKKGLIMIWSSLKNGSYVEAVSFNSTGNIFGKWQHQKELLFRKDGGHGMIFKDYKENLYLTLHYPNENYKEHPDFIRVQEKDETIKIIH